MDNVQWIDEAISEVRKQGAMENVSSGINEMNFVLYFQKKKLLNFLSNKINIEHTVE